MSTQLAPAKCSECGAVQGEQDHKMDCSSAYHSNKHPECRTCWIGGFGPSHDGYSCCRNMRVLGHGAIAAGGTTAHCTCAGCF